MTNLTLVLINYEFQRALCRFLHFYLWLRQISCSLIFRNTGDESDFSFGKLQFAEGALLLFAFLVIITLNQLYTCF